MSEQEKEKRRARGRDWWAEQIAKCQGSGQSMAAYARENKLNLSSLYNWKTTLNRAKGGITATKKITSTTKQRKDVQLEFVELAIDEKKLSGVVEIITPTGWTVRLPIEIGFEMASRFVSLIERRS